MSLRSSLTLLLIVAFFALVVCRPRRPKLASAGDMMSINSPRYASLLKRLERSVDSQIKICPKRKVYNTVLQKCVRQGRGTGVRSNGFGNGGFGGK